MLKKFLLLFLLALSVSSIHAQTVAYVTNPGNNTVSVIDTSTNTVTGTIAVGNGPEGVVFSPDGTRAYVANSSGDTVSVIDTTALSMGSTLRETTVCSAKMIWPAATIGSTTRFGRAAWPPIPVIRSSKSSSDAIKPPVRVANDPTRNPGALCSP